MTPFSRSMSSPYWQEDQKRAQRIQSLENTPNLGILQQIQLMNDRNTSQNLRREALGESQFRIKEKESLFREKQLDELMAFQPQMDSISGGIMSRMGGNLGVSLPKSSSPYSSGTGYNPSWMRSYQTPQFPNQ